METDKDLERMTNAAEMLWIVLANVSNGDWTKQTPEWQDCAARSRDEFHNLCSELKLKTV